MEVRKRGLVSLGQEDIQQGKVRKTVKWNQVRRLDMYRLGHYYYSPSSTVTVVIDGYTHNSTLTSGDSVSLGTQIILVCQVVGLPYGTPLNYTWTCQNGDCELVRYDRKIHMKYMLAINTTDVTYGGTYTCQVTATGGQEATGSFTISVTGM